jgi:hypothetical protein
MTTDAVSRQQRSGVSFKQLFLRRKKVGASANRRDQQQRQHREERRAEEARLRVHEKLREAGEEFETMQADTLC